MRPRTACVLSKSRGGTLTRTLDWRRMRRPARARGMPADYLIRPSTAPRSRRLEAVRPLEAGVVDRGAHAVGGHGLRGEGSKERAQRGDAAGGGRPAKH